MAFHHRERPRGWTEYRDAYFLSHCSPIEAHEWLRVQEVEFSRVFGTPETPANRHILEYILFRRRDPIIDLALAEHGRSRSVLRRLYNRSSNAIRIVCCGNASTFCGEGLDNSRPLPDDFTSDSLEWRIVRTGPLAELRAICENPHMNSIFYEQLLGAWKGEEVSRSAEDGFLSDRRFQYILSFLSRNNRVKILRDESNEKHYWDGFSEYRYNQLFIKAWHLAEKVPVDYDWAAVLASLYRNLRAPFNIFDDAQAVIDRWHIPGESTYGTPEEVRTEIAKHFLKPRVEMINDEDQAIRSAFFSTFDPDHRDFRDLNWEEWFDIDDLCYMELMGNLKVWRSRTGRQKLHDLLWHQSRKHHRLEEIGFFREREDEFRRSHPEWFHDEEDAEPNRSISANDLKLASQAKLDSPGGSEARSSGQEPPVGRSMALLAVGAICGLLIGLSVG